MTFGTHVQKNPSVFSPIFSLLLLASENRGTFSEKRSGLRPKRGTFLSCFLNVGPTLIMGPAAKRSGLEVSKTSLSKHCFKKTHAVFGPAFFTTCAAPRVSNTMLFPGAPALKFESMCDLVAVHSASIAILFETVRKLHEIAQFLSQKNQRLLNDLPFWEGLGRFRGILSGIRVAVRKAKWRGNGVPLFQFHHRLGQRWRIRPVGEHFPDECEKDLPPKNSLTVYSLQPQFHNTLDTLVWAIRLPTPSCASCCTKLLLQDLNKGICQHSMVGRTAGPCHVNSNKSIYYKSIHVWIYTTIVKTLNLLIDVMFLYTCSFSLKTYKTPMRRNNSQTFPLEFHLLSSHKVRSFPLLLPMSCLHKILFNHDGSKTHIHRLSTPRFGQR